MRATVGLDLALWRTTTFFRLVALVFAAVALGTRTLDDLPLGVVVVSALGVWTLAVGLRLPRHPRVHLGAEAVVALLALLASVPVVGADRLGDGAATLPGRWTGGLVLVAALLGGPVPALVAALGIVAVDVLLADGVGLQGTSNATLLVVVALAVGVLVRTARAATVRAEEQRAAAEAAATRARLAADVHDTVLQTLAYLHRQDGLEPAAVRALAGDAERRLRRLVGQERTVDSGPGDLVTALQGLADERRRHPQRPVAVSVASLVPSVELDPAVLHAVTGAVVAALDNVAAHVDPPVAGVLVEDGAPAPVDGVRLGGEASGDGLLVTVRDSGPGMTPERAAEASAAGRLGLAASIGGRMAAAGGVARLVTAPGEGCEVLLWLPQT